MANPRRRSPHQHFARPGVAGPDLLDRKRLVHFAQNGGFHRRPRCGGGQGPTSVPPPLHGRDGRPHRGLSQVSGEGRRGGPCWPPVLAPTHHHRVCRLPANATRSRGRAGSKPRPYGPSNQRRRITTDCSLPVRVPAPCSTAGLGPRRPDAQRRCILRTRFGAALGRYGTPRRGRSRNRTVTNRLSSSWSSSGSVPLNSAIALRTTASRGRASPCTAGSACSWRSARCVTGFDLPFELRPRSGGWGAHPDS